jgi:hypothetical protein
MSLYVILSSSCSVGHAAQTMMSFYWNELSLPMGDCVQRASSALTQAGFTDLHNQSPFIEASHGDYTALFFCGTHKGLITLVTMGPDQATSAAFLTSITSRFPGQRR